jgi:hypothetical protein
MAKKKKTASKKKKGRKVGKKLKPGTQVPDGGKGGPPLNK